MVYRARFNRNAGEILALPTLERHGDLCGLLLTRNRNRYRNVENVVLFVIIAAYYGSALYSPLYRPGKIYIASGTECTVRSTFEGILLPSVITLGPTKIYSSFLGISVSSLTIVFTLLMVLQPLLIQANRWVFVSY